VLFCTVLVGMILNRGLVRPEEFGNRNFHSVAAFWGPPELTDSFLAAERPDARLASVDDVWSKSRFIWLQDRRSNLLEVWTKQTLAPFEGNDLYVRGQYQTVRKSAPLIVNGKQQGKGKDQSDFNAVGQLGGIVLDSPSVPGPVDPFTYLQALRTREIVTWEKSAAVTASDQSVTTVFFPKLRTGADLLVPGESPTFSGIRSDKLAGKLNFISLMLALFAGTASLPHILIRYYTVKDQASARKSTVVGIASIGFFYILTLYLGLGAMTSGVLDPTNSNMAAPLLARSFGELPFAVISAIAFTTVLGTVSGLILAASGAVAHDLATGLLKLQLTDHEKVRVGKIAAVVVGVIGIVLGILFEKFNVSFLVGWAFNIAASANLPALIMLLFWKGTTKHGITASIFVGLFSSLAWVLMSDEAFKNIYGLKPEQALVPFSQPAIVTLPLAFVLLILVSLLTRDKTKS
jgi:cation/acetate symporter